MRPKVSVIIVDYKKADRVIKNVESLAEQWVNFPIEVIVVDNSCDSANAEKLMPLNEYEGVQVHINPENTGYAEANNQGASYATGDYILLCNPDIVWAKNDTLQTLVDFMEEHQKIGVLAPRQLNEDGSPALTIRAFPKFPLQVARRTWLRNVPGLKTLVEYDEMHHLNSEEVQTVDWVQSSFWLVRKSVWDELEGLNTGYFIFMSDPDFCFRCWQAGHEVVYTPLTHVMADGKRLSSGGVKDFFTKWTVRQHTREALKYSWEHLFSGNPHHQYLEHLRLPDSDVRVKE